MHRQNRKLTSVQWQCVKHGFVLSVGTVVIILGMYYLIGTYIEQNEDTARWLYTNLGLPLPLHIEWTTFVFYLIPALLMASLIGVVSGYIYGNLLKKRLNILWEAAMNLERGMLSYRVPELGVDELGEVGWQFNRLAAKWEEQVASLQRLSSHNAELGEQLRQAAIIGERQRLARELHDAVSQQLFAIAMSTAAIKRLIDKHPERAAQQIELVEEMAAAAQAEMRALLLHLRPATLQNKSLRQAMVELLEELKQKHVVGITWEVEDIPHLPTGIEDQLFRVLQEALSNTLRHARASSILVKLFTLQGQVRLRIADDGIGFDPEGEKMTSYGLVSMRERVNQIGGAMEIYSAVGKGTQIEIRIPVLIEATKGVETDDDPSYAGG